MTRPNIWGNTGYNGLVTGACLAVAMRRRVINMKMSTVDWVAWVFVVVGALNWGLMGVAGINLVEALVGTGTLSQVVYILVGLSGLYSVWMALSKKK